MKCATCGFAASDPGISACPFCKTGGSVSAPAFAGAAVWPPAPTAALPYAPSGGVMDREALKQQRQIGMVMDMGAMAAVYAATPFKHLLPQPYGTVVWAAVVIGCIYPHFRGSAHWAESKGYPRSTGRLAGILGWLGPLALAVMPDKTKSGA